VLADAASVKSAHGPLRGDVKLRGAVWHLLFDYLGTSVETLCIVRGAQFVVEVVIARRALEHSMQPVAPR
jgi:hypothetical protein